MDARALVITREFPDAAHRVARAAASSSATSCQFDYADAQNSRLGLVIYDLVQACSMMPKLPKNASLTNIANKQLETSSTTVVK